MPLLTHITPDQLREYWPRVRTGLLRLEDSSPDWIPEDAYHLLRLGMPHGACLSLIADDGFIIWQRLPGADGCGMLFVLAMVAENMLKHHRALSTELEELARQMQCRRIRYISKRTEWASLNWTLLGHVYEREL